jgi:hypothetical protein
MRLSGLLFIPLALAASSLAAEDKKPPSGHVTGDTAEIEATLLWQKEEIVKAVGSDLGGSIMIVEVTLTPKGEKPLQVSRDDFTLKSDNDGQRSQPFAPSQIAGRGTLMVSSTGRGAAYADQRGPVWGGYPGTGMPGRLPGDSPVAGSGTADTSEAKATVTGGDRKQDDPLLATLKEKVLPEKEAAEPLSGLLYFHMEGKHKPKHLELWYKSPSGKITLRFR